MDLVTASFLVLATLGAVAALLHMLGWVPPRYRRVLGDLQATFAQRVGIEVEAALDRVAAKQLTAMQEQTGEALKSAQMSMTRSVGVDKMWTNKANAALTEAIMGPALPILRQFAPGLAETLEENPQLLGYIIENPLFKKYVEPRIAQYLSASAGEGGVNLSP